MSQTFPLLKRHLGALLLACQFLLTACGPGTGGTGTGPHTVSAFSASYTNGVGASASVGAGSPTPAGTPTASPLPNPSPAPAPSPAPCTVGCDSNAATRTFSLQLQTDGITLTSPCAGFSYSGSWSVSAAGETSVPGVYTTSSVQQAAVLTAVFANASADSTSVTVSIRNAAGALLLGPLVLQRGTGSPATPATTGC